MIHHISGIPGESVSVSESEFEFVFEGGWRERGPCSEETKSSGRR